MKKGGTTFGELLKCKNPPHGCRAAHGLDWVPGWECCGNAIVSPHVFAIPLLCSVVVWFKPCASFFTSYGFCLGVAQVGALVGLGGLGWVLGWLGGWAGERVGWR